MIDTPTIRQTKEQGLQELSKFLKIIAQPCRLQILYLLQQGKMSVGEIQEKLDAPFNLVSFHLRPLKKAELIFSKKEGLNVYYWLNESKVCGYRMDLNYFLCERCELENIKTC